MVHLTYVLSLLLTAAHDGWTEAAITREVWRARHRVLANVQGLVASHRAILRQLAAGATREKPSSP